MQVINKFSTIPNNAATTLQLVGSHYPELLAKSANRSKVKWPQFDDGEALPEDRGLANNEDYFEQFLQDKTCRLEPDYIYRCTKGFVWGESSQNNFYKMICCGKEWCKDCGSKHSIPHDRRISRHLEKFLGIWQAKLPVQYLVITIPKELRKIYRSKEALRKFRRYWIEKLKRDGAGKKWQFGVSRYHYCGEDGYTWKPHLNILTIGSWISKEELRTMRAELSRWFKMEHKLDYNPIPNIYTAWTFEADKIRHWLSYINRATQVLYNDLNAEVINGFRNITPWKNQDFQLPQYKPQTKEEESEVIKALNQGFDLLPDGTKEKIRWRMKYSEIKRRMIPDLVLVEQTRINELIMLKRGIWKEPKIKKPPKDPFEPVEFSPEIFCPF